MLRSLLVLLITQAVLSYPAQAAPVATGLRSLSGASVDLDSTKSQMLVSFWATWCTECKLKLRNTLPELASSQEIDVVTINIESDSERVKAFVEKEKITLPVLQDPDRALRDRLKVEAVPHWAVYEREAGGAGWRLKDSAPAFDLKRVKLALGLNPP